MKQEMLISNFLMLVIVQQALVTQISWVKMLVSSDNASYSTLIGYNVGQGTVLLVQII
jgi:uncharacterized membrane protein YczE